MLTLEEFQKQPLKIKEPIVEGYLKSRYSLHNPVLKSILLQDTQFKSAIVNFQNYLRTYDTHPG